MSKDALTVRRYPFPKVWIACERCGRAGRYRRETLADRFGPDRGMPDVLGELARCHRRFDMSDPCQAIYPDLRGRWVRPSSLTASG